MDALPDFLIPTWTLLLGAAGILLYLWSTWNYDTFRKMGINGPRPLPFVGNMYELHYKSMADIDMDNTKAYGKIHGVFNGGMPVLMVGDPEAVKDVLVKEFSCFVNRTQLPSLQQKPLDRILSVICDDHWRHVRAKLSPTFTSGKLKQMMGTITASADNLTSYLDKQDGGAVNVKDVLSGYSMDVIAGTAFGLDMRSLENPDNPFLVQAKQFFSFSSLRSPKRLISVTIAFASQSLAKFLAKFGFTLFDAITVQYMENLVKDALKRDDSKENKRNFAQLCLDELIEPSEISSDSLRRTADGMEWTTKGLLVDDIVSNSIIFLIAGYETVATFLSMFCYAMATNPEIQKKVYESIKANDLLDGISYDKLKDLHYLDMCIDETLRMYPPAMRLDRTCNKDATVGGVHVRAGMTVNVPVYAIHYDPDYWPDPYTFRPERFSPDEKAAQHPCAYLPFGAGPRNCIGMRLALLEAKAVIVRLLSKYVVTTCHDTPMPPLKLGATFGLLSPTKPIELHFRKRQI